MYQADDERELRKLERQRRLRERYEGRIIGIPWLTMHAAFRPVVRADMVRWAYRRENRN
jgi:hypothetical protein